MDYLEERFNRKEILRKIVMEIRVANPVDLHKPVQSPDKRTVQSFPPPRHNGFLLTEGQGTSGMTYYTQGKAAPSHKAQAGRQQSLPDRKAQGDEKQRQANSAPSRKNRSQAQRVPLPRLNTLVAKSRGPGGDTSHIVTTNFAGYSTKDQEASPTRYYSIQDRIIKAIIK
ncbi:uncharacterized protein LOC143296091 [Babylonia areolata]|uniref:uncharacterized protein LOC143296091 n=1 Tax=Babylonia areolata TaxID=304850 RepID=UPI003FD68E47